MAKLLVWRLHDIREVIEKCVNNKFDMIIFIEGNRGLGKSTLAYKILRGLKIPMPFRAKRDIVYTREETLKHLATKKGGAIFSDEMINVAYNRDFYQEEQKTLLKALNMYRDSCNVFIGCIPKFVELDRQIQRLCKMRITVVRRGIALIQTQRATIYSQDPWDIKTNQKLEDRWTIRGGRNPQYARLTTVRGIIKYGDLHPKHRDLYEAIKAEKRNKVFGEYQDTTLLGNPEKTFYSNLLDRVVNGKLTEETFDTFAEINGIDRKKLRQKMNNLLKERGDNNRLKDYLFDKDKKIKRDKLGFVIESSKEAFTGKENKKNEKKHIQTTEEKLPLAEISIQTPNNNIKEETVIDKGLADNNGNDNENDDENVEGGNIFGFEDE